MNRFFEPSSGESSGRIIPDIETQSPADIKRFEEVRLQQQLAYLDQNSPFYSRLFRENRIDVSKIKTLGDLTHIPVSSKDDLQANNSDFICVDKSKVIDYCTTSGTLGDPVTFALTDSDLNRLAYNEHISFVCANGSEHDIYQLITTIDRRFMAGLAYFMGIRRMGAGIIRVGSGIPELQWDTINRISPNAFITVPSFILRIIEYAEAHGIDYRNSSIRKAVCIGEPLQNPDFSLTTLGKRIKDKWDIDLFTTYASTEMSGCFTDCGQHHGGHHHPELIIPEFLDENNNPVAEGEAGEVTFTTLGVEGMPLLRFKTGDICYHYTEPCACGRNTLRVGPIIGRKKQMIKYKGTSLYPPALYDILDNIPNVANYVVEVSTNNIGTDDILIRIGCNKPISDFDKTIKDHFRAKLRVAPTVKIETVDSVNKTLFPEMSRKPVKFIDKR
ncbi:MAG TPA: AMP-binding protein [Bacteroidales bacterium]|nr:AMP-binding protein [Bacteroidales bacterium]